MRDLEEFLMLRDLFNKELSISEIARRTGHSRETVRKTFALKFPLHPRKHQRSPANWMAIENISSRGFKSIHSLPSAFIVRSKKKGLLANIPS